MSEIKKTGVSFECTLKQRENYIKAAGGKKLGVWIQSILDAAVKQQATGTKKKVQTTATTDVKLVIDDEDDGDSVGNR